MDRVALKTGAVTGVTGEVIPTGGRGRPCFLGMGGRSTVEAELFLETVVLIFHIVILKINNLTLDQVSYTC